MQTPAAHLLKFVWSAYDIMNAQRPHIDERDLERSITQLLEPRIRDVMSGDEPYYIQHGPYERETMAAPPAQPPQYDLAFVLYADERIMWPLEAKILLTPGTLAEYESEIRSQFLTCRYAPFTSSGAMVAYLLSGNPEEALVRISGKLGVALETVSEFSHRPHRRSAHNRTVPSGKPYTNEFWCHHMILEFSGLRRHKGPQGNS